MHGNILQTVLACECCATVIACSLAGLCDWSPKSTRISSDLLATLPQHKKHLQVACFKNENNQSAMYTFSPIPITFAIPLHIPRRINFVCSCVQSVKHK